MNKTILIVEDQGLVRAGMKSLLRLVAPDTVIHEAANYDEALVQVQAHALDIVFLDLDLREEKNGMDLLHFIRTQEMPVKVIMLSATDDRETVLECIAAGASGYIAKSSGDESVFEHALSTVFKDAIFLPATILHSDHRANAPRKQQVSDLKQLGLSRRQAEVLYYLCQGLTNKGIANRMGISEGTVRKNYVSELLRLFNVTRRAELIIEISRLGIRIPAPEHPH